MKTSDLSGAELDYWVALVLGGKVEEFARDGMRMIPTRCFPELSEWDLSFCRLSMNPKTMNGLDYSFHPSTNWSQGGPLIEKYKVALEYDQIYENKEPTGQIAWHAMCWDGADYMLGIGPTPLIAAMRAIVASVYGDSVDD